MKDDGYSHTNLDPAGSPFTEASISGFDFVDQRQWTVDYVDANLSTSVSDTDLKDVTVEVQWTQREEKIGSVSNLTLSCIIWNERSALAFINESVVHVGDKINDKTIKRIEQNRVILTNGTEDYVLELQE